MGKKSFDIDSMESQKSSGCRVSVEVENRFDTIDAIDTEYRRPIYIVTDWVRLVRGFHSARSLNVVCAARGAETRGDGGYIPPNNLTASPQ